MEEVRLFKVTWMTSYSVFHFQKIRTVFIVRYINPFSLPAKIYC